MSARPLLATLAVAGSLLALASCASGSDNDAAPTAQGDGACTPAEAPTVDSEVTVEHALGTTTIPAGASRVASVGWGNQDVALALGFAPVGADDQTWSMTGDDGLGLYDWTLDGYAALCADEPVIFDTTDGVDFEAIADAAPDVILAAYSGLSEDDYATLSKIAPTVAYPDIPCTRRGARPSSSTPTPSGSPRRARPSWRTSTSRSPTRRPTSRASRARRPPSSM
jgi:iron complex transport system substrate-binding protein